MSVLAGGGVNVHARHPHPGEQAAQFLLHLLRTRPEVADIPAAALRALPGRGFGMAAVVAVQLPVAALDVVGQGHIAVRALHHMPAAAAADEGIVPPAVHQQHGLLALAQAVPQPGHQPARKHRAVALLQFPAHINNFHLGHGAVVYPGRHLHQGIIPPARLCEG